MVTLDESWQDFEQNCYDYLRTKYKNAKFLKVGDENPQYADIIVVKPDCSFFIESKKPEAQCGQFVLQPNDATRRFEYSPRNKTPFFAETEHFIKAMDSDFDLYSIASTAGKDIHVAPKICFDWVKRYYASKGVKYFISRQKSSANDYVIAPIEKLEDYFSISAKYREKKSGSSNPTCAQQIDLADVLDTNNIHPHTIHSAGGKTEVHSSWEMDKIKLPHPPSGKTFYFKKADKENVYKVTVLSNTRNSNVIFSIILISNQNADDLKKFELDIQL